MRDSVNSYYSTTLRSDDELAPSETRNVSSAAWVTPTPAEPGTLPADPKCQGAMQKTTTEAALYTQLVHFRRLLDYPGALARMPPKDRDAARARMESSARDARRARRRAEGGGTDAETVRVQVGEPEDALRSRAGWRESADASGGREEVGIRG